MSDDLDWRVLSNVGDSAGPRAPWRSTWAWPTPPAGPAVVQVLVGDPDDRPDGFPCFGCGAQVREERLIDVEWPGGRRTAECICETCAPRYGL